MTQNISNWFITDDNRAKAQVKYELKLLESRLGKFLTVYRRTDPCPDGLRILCGLLSNKYLDYLKCIGYKNPPYFSELHKSNISVDWFDHINLILNFKERLSKVIKLEEERKLALEIASLYHQLISTNSREVAFSNGSGVINESEDYLKHLFQKDSIKLWLKTLVEFWNLRDDQNQEPTIFFRNWTQVSLQHALDFFANEQLVDLVNAIFFYKLYPDKLFNELIHPEKLVSIRMRLSALHCFIERLQKELFNTVDQREIKPRVDYLFHGDELPQGIMIEVNQEFREIIQSAVKQLKIKFTPENEAQVTLERLHDLLMAYKFWFNPNRLIDAVMVLQQRLVKEKTTEEADLAVFHQEMIVLYRQLTTTECLDLYGYFANNDSRYLLYTLFIIGQGQSLDWLNELNKVEKLAIESVFQALKCVMEALRVELKNRHVSTEPYIYDLAKQYLQAGRRNRDAVYRIIAIYGRETVTISDNVEKLFCFMEGN